MLVAAEETTDPYLAIASPRCARRLRHRGNNNLLSRFLMLQSSRAGAYLSEEEGTEH
jgi:hypothetical protein